MQFTQNVGNYQLPIKYYMTLQQYMILTPHDFVLSHVWY